MFENPLLNNRSMYVCYACMYVWGLQSNDKSQKCWIWSNTQHVFHEETDPAYMRLVCMYVMLKQIKNVCMFEAPKRMYVCHETCWACMYVWGILLSMYVCMQACMYVWGLQNTYMLKQNQPKCFKNQRNKHVCMFFMPGNGNQTYTLMHTKLVCMYVVCDVWAEHVCMFENPSACHGWNIHALTYTLNRVCLKTLC